MPSTYAYQKFSGGGTTHCLKQPADPTTHAALGTELATIDGTTYVVLPDGATLPDDQPAEIAASIQQVTLTSEQREAIKAVSPHALLISSRIIDRIRAEYPLDEELFLARIAVGALQGSYTLQAGEAEELAAYQVCAEAAREWGRGERAKLGL